jgi:hypothetical protein
MRSSCATCYGPDGPRIEFWWRMRLSTSIQTGPVAYPTSFKTCTDLFTEGYGGRCLALSTHPI